MTSYVRTINASGPFQICTSKLIDDETGKTLEKEVYVYHNGRLIHKRWDHTGSTPRSRTFAKHGNFNW